MVLVGKKAPGLNAKAVLNGQEIAEHFSLEQYLGNRYVLLFFYPKDFTFVCPTELHAFQKALPEFEKRNVQIVACSTDSEYSHFAWLQVPANEGGIQGVTYPLVADINKTIAEDYDVLAGAVSEDVEGNWKIEGELVAYRGLFLIDQEGVVQHQIVNNMPLGRSVSEALRVVDALQYSEKYGEVCPADWVPGESAIKEDRVSVSDYLGTKYDNS